MKTGISVALKRVKADLVIKNANIFHLTTGKFELADIAIVDGLIAGIGHGYPADAEFDAQGRTAVPGFIDAHAHIESSMVTPRQFEQCVLPHGVTTVACDPHELANVVGEAAFEYFFSAAEGMDLDMQVRLSSCVPATPLETAGAAITADVLKNWHQCRYFFQCHAPHDGKLFFPPIPMSFHDDDGVITPFWSDFYSHRALDVPEGVPGTNPGELSRRKCVRIKYKMTPFAK